MRYVFKNKILSLSMAIFDGFGHLACFPLKLFKRRIPKKINNILVIRLDHIGDVVNATLIAKNIKNCYPDAKLTFLINPACKDLLKNNPYIDAIIAFEAPWFFRNQEKKFRLKEFFGLARKLHRQRFDLGIDLRGDLRHIALMSLAGIKFTVGYGITGAGFLLEKKGKFFRNRHEIDRNLHLLNCIAIKEISCEPKIYTDNHCAYEVEGILKKYALTQADFIALIHTQSTNSAKNWKKGNFIRLANLLKEKLGAKIIFVGAEIDKKINDEIIELSGGRSINLSGKLSLLTLHSLCQRASLFIGVDSGPAHIAAASRIPTIILYSATNKKEEWAPKSENTVVIQKEVACGPCEKTACSLNVCMDKITPEEVLATAERLVRK